MTLMGPDGSTAYVNPGPVMANVVMEPAKKRAPILQADFSLDTERSVYP